MKKGKKLVNEVDAEEVEEQAAKDEVCECSLIRYALELNLVLWVRLDPQASCEHELTHCGAKAGQKCVERKIPCNSTVHELQYAHRNQKCHEAIQELDPLRRLLHVLIPHTPHNILRRAGVQLFRGS